MSKSKLPMLVIKIDQDEFSGGGFVPAYGWVSDVLREKGYRIGDIIHCSFSKPRNPKFNSLVHIFGNMLKNNIPGFEYLSAHQVLKRIQIEANIACDEVALIMPGVGPVTYRMPQSLSFASMEEGKFKEMFENIIKYVVTEYWPDLTPEQIEEQRLLIEGPDPEEK